MQGKLCRLSRTESVTDKKGGIGDLCTTPALQISLIKYITCSPVKSKHQFFGVRTSLGVGFKHFSFSPRTLGKWSNLTSIFFKWVGSTTNQFCTCFVFSTFFALTTSVIIQGDYSHWLWALGVGDPSAFPQHPGSQEIRCSWLVQAAFSGEPFGCFLKWWYPQIIPF